MPDLNLDVHIAPMRPMKGAPPQGPGEPADVVSDER